MSNSFRASPADQAALQESIVRALQGRVETLPQGARTQVLRGIRGQDLVRLLQEALEPERRRFETTEMAYQDQIAQLSRRLEVLRSEREEILQASDETRRYELPRLAAMVEVERSRAETLERETQELEQKLTLLEDRLEPDGLDPFAGDSEQQDALAEEEGDESSAERLLLELDSRLHAIEESQAFSREAVLESFGQQQAAEEESLKLALEQFAQAEERSARLSAIEEAVWALADGDVDPERLAEMRTRTQRPSPALLELLQQCVERQTRSEARLEEMVGALRQTQELLAEEVRCRAELQRDVGRLQRGLAELQRRRLPPDEAVPWPLPEGASTQDLNRVLEALRSEGELRERSTHEQVERLSHATRAALERLANLLDAALAGAGGADPIPLDELDRLLDQSSGDWTQEQPQSWTPTVLPPYVEEELLPEELEPDDDPLPESEATEPDRLGTVVAPSHATTWFEVETERGWSGPDQDATEKGWGEPDDGSWEEARQETWEDLSEDRDQVAGTVERLLGTGPIAAPPADAGRPRLVESSYVESLVEVPEAADDEGELLLDMPDDSEVLDGDALVLVASDSEGEDTIEAFEAAAEADDWLAAHADEPGAAAADDWLRQMAQSLEVSAATGTPIDPSTEVQALEMPAPEPTPAPEPPSEALVAPAPGRLRATRTDGDEDVTPDELRADLEVARGSDELTTRRLARGLVSAMRSGEELQTTLEALRAERDSLQSKAKHAEQALESEVWRGLATHRELLAARERLRELEARLEEQLKQVEGQPSELEDVLDRPLPGMHPPGVDAQLIRETADLRREVEDRDSVLHWLLLESDPQFHDTKSRAIRACETALEDLRATPLDSQREAEEERVQELLHWLRSERDEGRGANAPPVDF